jgi:hypothetical protein
LLFCFCRRKPALAQKQERTFRQEKEQKEQEYLIEKYTYYIRKPEKNINKDNTFF